MKDDFVMPILVLVLICLFVTGALAATNAATAPIITAAAAERAERARNRLISDTSFVMIDSVELPDTVREAYKAENGAGFIFIVAVRGYGGDIIVICAIDSNGVYINSETLDHSETSGIGTRISEPQFLDQFTGADHQLSGVSAVTGATVSTEAYIRAISDVFTAFEIVKGVG